jgi:acyl-CoA synthetase (AMP-forming)/AMP-acid ligase II
MSPERRFGQMPQVQFQCLPYLLEYQARRIPDALAILAQERDPLTYGRLYQHIETMGSTFRRFGIGRHDRVVIVLPNGPELAVAILTVAATAVCVPLNPAFGTEEVEAYFADLHPRVLITQTQIDTPARRAAQSQGIPVIELSIASDKEAGLFTLMGDKNSAPRDEPVSPSDSAVLLPTSGTTSRPKIVRQTHANMCKSAYATGAALALRETDRCLNILPLFHGHGLHATLVASLAAGASVVCTPGFDVDSFAAWLAAFQPTWYSAVPTMHQAILIRARHNRERLANAGLRFVRSSSAPLPPRIFEELEKAFESPVIEWYGMTEVTSSPIACNPPPPHQRKAGSVGVPVDLDVAITDERGAFLSAGKTGQVVVRGASVTSGYDGNPKATEEAFAGNWLKTGDLGCFDEDGYLFLEGRIREIINRGGEKVAPQQVDEVLLDHPAVAEAVTFAVPHLTLGEDVAAAIVLRPHAVADSKDIRQFVTSRIAEFKVPRQIIIVSQIPKGPTGKVQRIGLAAKLGLDTTSAIPTPAFVGPRTPLEKVLAEYWADILQLPKIGVHDDFFAAGGDSLLATLVLIHIYDVTHRKFDISHFFAAPTIAEVASHLEWLLQSGHAPPASSGIVRVQRQNGTAPATFAQERLWKLQRALPDIPFFNVLYGLRLTSPIDKVLLERSINAIVERHESLRTTFNVVDGQCLQVIAPHLAVPLAFNDLSALPDLKKKTSEQQLIENEVLHPFDLAKGPLIRARLARLREQEHLFLISMHQLICDGWSLAVYVEELAALYDAFSGGDESPLAPLPIQLADFAHWQRQWQSDQEMVAQFEYWREQLRDPLPVMQLATPTMKRMIDDLRTTRRGWMISSSLVQAADRFSQEEGGTIFVALVAALKTLLHRYMGQDDVRVATNVANRNRPGTQGLIGPVVNTVILRTNLGGDPSPREVMRRVRATTLAALDHQEIPFEELIQMLQCERRGKPLELANIMILLQNSILRPSAGSGRGLRFRFEEANPNMLVPLVTMTSFDVIIALRETSEGLAGTCVFKPHLFHASMIDRLLRDFKEVLQHMTMHPERPISSLHASLNEPESDG